MHEELSANGNIEQVSWVTWYGNGKNWLPWMVFGGVECDKAFWMGYSGMPKPEWFNRSPLGEAYEEGVLCAIDEKNT